MPAGPGAPAPHGLTVFVVEDAHRQHRLQVLQLDLFPLPPCPPEVQGRLGDQVSTCITALARDATLQLSPSLCQIHSPKASFLFKC